MECVRRRGWTLGREHPGGRETRTSAPQRGCSSRGAGGDHPCAWASGKQSPAVGVPTPTRLRGQGDPEEPVGQTSAPRERHGGAQLVTVQRRVSCGADCWGQSTARNGSLTWPSEATCVCGQSSSVAPAG